ncbi:Hypothetical_protein [Hexamita inflata]|uniref:Hypothetical_protein n=1 Tax=Hexamita inflata TaxID=28002 RepID=A0AA86NEC0_9EUKA|nr:Hypothetical protein HINF_LOCUS5604 [Hexamita inflata]CAI9917960.1 Hypothetical protein HINF_LOCUS5605 [Hexamita inflata]
MERKYSAQLRSWFYMRRPDTIVNRYFDLSKQIQYQLDEMFEFCGDSQLCSTVRRVTVKIVRVLLFQLILVIWLFQLQLYEPSPKAYVDENFLQQKSQTASAPQSATLRNIVASTTQRQIILPASQLMHDKCTKYFCQKTFLVQVLSDQVSSKWINNT